MSKTKVSVKSSKRTVKRAVTTFEFYAEIKKLREYYEEIQNELGPSTRLSDILMRENAALKTEIGRLKGELATEKADKLEYQSALRLASAPYEGEREELKRCKAAIANFSTEHQRIGEEYAEKIATTLAELNLIKKELGDLKISSEELDSAHEMTCRYFAMLENLTLSLERRGDGSRSTAASAANPCPACAESCAERSRASPSPTTAR